MLKMYTMQNCANCMKLKMFLNAQKVDFELIDITNNEDMLSQFREVGLQTMPIIEYVDKEGHTKLLSNPGLTRVMDVVGTK